MKSEAWKNICRSWTQHTGTQIATFSVLVATFTLITTMLTLVLNLRGILYFWGESVHITAYVEESQSDEDVSAIRKAIEDMGGFKSVDYISKEKAKQEFEKEVKTFIPEILDDEEMGNPFPASFQLGLEKSLMVSLSATELDGLAGKLKQLPGIEDVAYGQDWVNNYGSLVSGVGRLSMLLAAILLAGSVLVVGNSLRASLASRREEIEILELLGATTKMIRRPYIYEGAFMGLVGGVLALALAATFYHVGLSAMSGNLHMAAVGSQLKFLNWQWMAFMLTAFTSFGVLGSYLTVRRMNHGYAAARG